MLRITEYDLSNNYRTLTHSDEVFHKALRAVLNGERRFHVKGAAEKYDLIYEDNNDFFFAGNNHSQNTMFAGETMTPPYYIYNEHDDSKFNFQLFDRFESIVFEKANEYTIVLAKIFLRLTDKKVSFLDDKAKWFIQENERFQVGVEPSGCMSEIRVVEEKVPLNFYGDHIMINSISLFHEIFLLQWICGDISLENVKYVEFCVKKTEGIGALLQFCVKCSSFFGEYGIKAVFKLGSSRYNDEMLKKYFRIETTPEDSNESNTIYLVNYMAVVRSYTFIYSKAKVSLDILNPDFLSEMDEYAEAVLTNKHMLGVLFRGTDYKIMLENSKMTPMTPVSVEIMLPIIRDYLEKYHFDGIFVATEDDNALKIIRKAFPGKVYAVAQERHTIDEFKPGTTISDLERDAYNAQEYEERVMDKTINYFYALYMLSKCDGFLASSYCSGVMTVRDFNAGKFECNDVVREMILKGLITVKE